MLPRINKILSHLSKHPLWKELLMESFPILRGVPGRRIHILQGHPYRTVLMLRSVVPGERIHFLQGHPHGT